MTPGADLGPLPSKASAYQACLLAGWTLTLSGVTVICERSLGGRDEGLLVDGLGRPFDTHVDRGVGCAGLECWSRGCDSGRNEEDDGGQSGE